MSTELKPATLRDANALVARWHSHHKPVRGHLFSIGAYHKGECVGVVIVGRPVAAGLQDGTTYEITRLCTNGHRNAASKLIASAWRAARAMGVVRMVSYTRLDELGTCYRAAGWRPVSNVKGREWTSGNKRERWLPGLYQATTEIVDRVRWEVAA